MLLRLPVRLSLAIALAAALAPSAALAGGRSTRLTLTRVSVVGARVTVSGRVRLPVDSAKERRRTIVWLTLAVGAGKLAKTESFSARLDPHERFSATHTTKLRGKLSLAAVVKIAGRRSGALALRSVQVAPAGATAPSGGSTPSSPSASSPTPSSPGTSTSNALNGTFQLTAASESAGTLSGSWFEMLVPGGGAPLANSNSPLANQDFTPLSPGTDGGLQTFAYQPAPTPAFAEEKSGKPVGNALAARIMQPQEFEGYNFSVVTQASDPQNGEADPLPQIVNQGGTLSGELTAWAVGWNGQWFNQGSPKPDGTLSGGTTAVAGTYDATTHHYVLEWKSLIVGGPFGGFVGAWHLEGTFVPAG